MLLRCNSMLITRQSDVLYRKMNFPGTFCQFLFVVTCFICHDKNHGFLTTWHFNPLYKKWLVIVVTKMDNTVAQLFLVRQRWQDGETVKRWGVLDAYDNQAT